MLAHILLIDDAVLFASPSVQALISARYEVARQGRRGALPLPAGLVRLLEPVPDEHLVDTFVWVLAAVTLIRLDSALALSFEHISSDALTGELRVELRRAKGLANRNGQHRIFMTISPASIRSDCAPAVLYQRICAQPAALRRLPTTRSAWLGSIRRTFARIVELVPRLQCVPRDLPSMHGLRRGAAFALFRAGASRELIQTTGDWRASPPATYLPPEQPPPLQFTVASSDFNPVDIILDLHRPLWTLRAQLADRLLRDAATAGYDLGTHR